MGASKLNSASLSLKVDALYVAFCGVEYTTRATEESDLESKLCRDSSTRFGNLKNLACCNCLAPLQIPASNFELRAMPILKPTPLEKRPSIRLIRFCYGETPPPVDIRNADRRRINPPEIGKKVGGSGLGLGGGHRSDGGWEGSLVCYICMQARGRRIRWPR